MSSSCQSSSYSELVEHHKQVLGIMLSSVKVSELKATSLLAVVTKEDVDRAPSKKKKKRQQQQQALSHMEKDISRYVKTSSHVAICARVSHIYWKSHP